MGKRFTAALAAVLLSACATSSEQGGAQTPPGAQCSGSVAITNVTILTMTDAGALPDQTVLVRDGRIARIGDADDVRTPRRACVVNGQGRFLMPGLADAHVHLYDEGDLALYLRFGVTSVFNMGGSNMHLHLREALRIGAIDGPTLYTTGPMLKVDATPLLEFEETPRNEAEAAGLVRAYHGAGYDAIKVWGAFSPEMYQAIVSAAANDNIPVTGHIPRAVGLGPVLASHQSIAHVEEFINKHFRGDPSAEDIAATARQVASARTPVVSTLITYEAIAASNQPDLSALQQREGVEFMDPVRRAMWGPGANRLRQQGRDPQRFLRELQVEQQITAGLQNAGVNIVAGTDAGELPGLVPGLDLHRELELLVQAGLTPEQALRTATVNFAAFVGQQGGGVIAEGAPADLLLLDADPRANISNTRAIAGVMTRGAYYSRAELDALVATLQARNQSTGAYVGAVMQGGAEAGERYIAARQQGAAPPGMTPIMFLALGLAQRGDLATSEAILRQAAAMHPTRAEPWFIIAGLRRVQNDPHGALSAYDEVIIRAPDHERAERERETLRALLESTP